MLPRVQLPSAFAKIKVHLPALSRPTGPLLFADPLPCLFFSPGDAECGGHHCSYHGPASLAAHSAGGRRRPTPGRALCALRSVVPSPLFDSARVARARRDAHCWRSRAQRRSIRLARRSAQRSTTGLLGGVLRTVLRQTHALEVAHEAMKKDVQHLHRLEVGGVDSPAGDACWGSMPAAHSSLLHEKACFSACCALLSVPLDRASSKCFCCRLPSPHHVELMAELTPLSHALCKKLE